MHQQLTRSTYSIVVGEGDRAQSVEVDGVVLTEVRELGLHFGQQHQIDVTHIPSGKRIGGFDTLGAALEFACRIAYVTNWKTSTPALTEAEVSALSSIRTHVLTTTVAP